MDPGQEADEAGQDKAVSEDKPEDAALALIAWLMRRQGGRLWMAAEGRGSCLALAVAAFATAEEPR